MGDGFHLVGSGARAENSPARGAVDLRHFAEDSGEEIEQAKNLVEGIESLAPSEFEGPLRRHSGEPDGEPPTKFIHQEFRSSGNNSMLEMPVIEPEIAPFPYADTKLRPEAPPFTPECISPDPGEGDGSSCFVNVELKLAAREEEVFHDVDRAPAIIVDQRLALELDKEASLAKPSSPDVEATEFALAEGDTIATAAVATCSRRESPRDDRVSVLSPAFFLGNKTRIIILLASVAICVILVIFILV